MLLPLLAGRTGSRRLPQGLCHPRTRGLRMPLFADRGLTSRAPRQIASCREFGKTRRHLSPVTPENEWCCSRPCEQQRAPIAWVVAEETEKWTKVIRAANIAVE